jgi:hypothetical protein
VVDLIAFSDQDLLNQVDGRQVKLNSGTVTLHTKNATIVVYGMSGMDQFLNIISDPNIAYLMMMLGFFGIMFEFFNPGAILPGIIGVISLILAFYAMHSLPVNYAGLALVIFGVLLLLLEIKVVSHGMLAIGGVISLAVGFDDADQGQFAIGTYRHFYFAHHHHQHDNCLFLPFRDRRRTKGSKAQTYNWPRSHEGSNWCCPRDAWTGREGKCQWRNLERISCLGDDRQG